MAETPRRRQSPRFSTGAAPSGVARSQASQGRSPRPARIRAAASHVGAPRATASRVASTGATGMHQVVTPRSRAQRAQAARGGHSLRGPILGAVVALAAVVLVAVVFVLPRCSGADKLTQDTLPNQGAQIDVTIADGSGAVSIASALEQAGVVASADEFVAEVQRQRADSSLKSGTFVFTVGSSLDDIIALLEAGPNSASGKLSIPEGLTLTQTAATVEQTLGIASSDFLAQAKASNYVSSYSFLSEAANDSLEGFLWPKTYDFSGQANVTADVVIRAMLDQYAKETASLDFDAARTLVKERYGVDMSNYQFLTLASIIEREAVTQSQRPKVSSVFYNRLKAGMMLQSDATMMYVTGGEVTADDLKQESPYNTYLNQGLTPTPICSPSLESLEAALAPDDTNYLYFFITQTGEWFSTTHEEHLQAIEQNR